MKVARTVTNMHLFLFLMIATTGVFAADSHTTIIYDDVAFTVAPAREDAIQLWITLSDLKRATGFELKPQGVCRLELCFPIPKTRQKEFVNKASFNLTAFAQLVHQPVAHDGAANAWYFGLRADQRQSLASLRAPDFTLPDLQGKPHSLSEFRGKKVFLITWASW
jgi:hypothetical protein